MTQTLLKTDGLSEGLLDSALDSLPNAVVLFDRKLACLYRNEAARRLLSNDCDLPGSLQKLSLEGGLQNWAIQLREVMETGRSFSADLATQIGADQPESFLTLSVAPLRDSETGVTFGGIILAEDVSGRIGMERRLAISERLAAVGKLAARVAHELNNPLDGILRFVNLAVRRISEQESPDPKISDYLEHIRGGILRMRDIVSSLLEFSRFSPAAVEQATINKLVEDAVSALEGRAQESRVAVVCNFLQTDMPVFRGGSIFQVFCNIIKNAIDAMPDGGTLTITTRILGPDVVICFEDTGVGLPADVEKLFEPFFTTKAPGKGTGLGLAVCRELIEKYSGTIAAARREPKGASFVVRIPVRNCSAGQLGRNGVLAQ